MAIFTILPESRPYLAHFALVPSGLGGHWTQKNFFNSRQRNYYQFRRVSLCPEESRRVSKRAIKGSVYVQESQFQSREVSLGLGESVLVQESQSQYRGASFCIKS